MINVKVNTREFAKDMKNILSYSEGFLEGAKIGKKELLENIGTEAIYKLKEFIDASARVNPMTLHHVYEWYQTGSPAARLFDIQYQTSSIGLSFNSTFRQSVSIKQGSKVPFYNKATIMENGIPVRIQPVQAKALVFEDNGETIFTKNPVTISEPGGNAVQGGYERVFNYFFGEYFTQSFLRYSGILDHLENPKPFKSNISKGKRGGKSAGISVGYKWISKKGA
jgi:hypothetical protein